MAIQCIFIHELILHIKGVNGPTMVEHETLERFFEALYTPEPLVQSNHAAYTTVNINLSL